MTDLSQERPGRLTLRGSPAADLFSREVAESLQGLLTYNLVSESGQLPAGFVHASPPGQGWSFTMWTRDAGVFLRELVLWGYFQHAKLVAGCLMDLVARNEAGFLAFPEHFRHGERRAGHEIDGTCAIVIGLVLLWERLASDDQLRPRILAFLCDPGSPLDFLEHELSARPLIAGTGEFGPGCGISGAACNVVQNHLAVLAALAAARMDRQRGDEARAGRLTAFAERIRQGMEQHLVDRDRSWIWCVAPDTLKPVPEVINHPVNLGFGGINGVASMYADVLGLEPALDPWPGIAHCRHTFRRLHDYPQRKQALERWGIWTQFDVFNPGTPGINAGELTSPSYGHGYALQTMLLFDWMDLADKALVGLAEGTYDKGQVRSPYFFYERMYAPPRADAARHGCAELNLVCAAEPLKVARLILGLDDGDPAQVRILPRLPASVSAVEAEDWPIRVGDRVVRADLACRRGVDGLRLELAVRDGRIDDLAIRLGANRGFCRQRLCGVSSCALHLPADPVARLD